MDIRDFVARLHVSKGPTAKGEYLCRCPAHDDRKASLCVTEGEKGIIFKCQAGCDKQAVLDALGLKVDDLVSEDWKRRKGGPKGPTSARNSAPPNEARSLGAVDDRDEAVRQKDKHDSRPGMKVRTVQPPKQPDAEEKTYPSYEAAYGYLGTFVCAYVYRDTEGKPLFEVARIDDSAKAGKPSKTFRQHRMLGEGWTPPLVLGVPDALRDALYRLPEVKQAIADGKTVYVVEGEKDADNLAKLGYAATTNAMGAEKWRKAHSEHLRGADVCILPDNDAPGRKHADKVAHALMYTAKSVRVLDIAAECPELPKKGDITDFFKLLGKSKATAALEKLMADTPPMQPDPAEIAAGELAKAAEIYDGIFNYCVDHGRICQETQDGLKPLANFVALPRFEVIRDDGVNVMREMLIDGWTAEGTPLPRVSVKNDQFNSMGWVTTHWGFSANIMPGNMIKDRLRYVINEAGRMTAKRVTEYTHMGWRKIGGQWAYLYQGGAIGAEGVTVDLGSGLSEYRLDGSGAEGFDEITLEGAGKTTLNICEIMAEHVAIPLLGTVFLAPLREFLAATGVAPAYALFLLGGTGTRKSTALALALSHFGNFTGKSLPASFNDTANFIRKKAFLLKDAPIVVDDYHPVTSLQERKKMEATAQSLARAFGDGAERGRMKSDLTLQESMPPRGVAIISGEDTPGVGESGMARFFVVNVGRGDIPATDELTEMQELARNGYLQKSMRGYILWLLKQADELPELLHGDFLRNRATALNKVKGQHGRSAEAIAHMMLGYDSMLRYMRDVGAITTEEAVKLSTHAWEVVTQNSERQADEMREDRPSKIFLASIGELLVSRAAGVRDLTIPAGEPGHASTPREMIGYMDDAFYYLLPNVAYRAVAKLCNEQGQAFPLTAKMLYKQMREDGILTADIMTQTSATRPKWIDGRSQRLLWIPRQTIDGPKVGQEQTRMRMTPLTGCEAVDGTDMPEDAPF